MYVLLVQQQVCYLRLLCNKCGCAGCLDYACPACSAPFCLCCIAAAASAVQRRQGCQQQQHNQVTRVLNCVHNQWLTQAPCHVTISSVMSASVPVPQRVCAHMAMLSSLSFMYVKRSAVYLGTLHQSKSRLRRSAFFLASFFLPSSLRSLPALMLQQE